MYDLIYNLLIQGISLIAFVFLLISFWKKDKEEIIAYQNISQLFYIIHYSFLGASLGAFVSFMVIVRNVVLFKAKNPDKWMKAFAVFFVIEGLIFYNGISSFFPVLAAATYSLAIISDRKSEIIKAGILADVFWFIYNILVASYIGIITEAVLFVTDSLALRKSLKTNN